MAHLFQTLGYDNSNDFDINVNEITEEAPRALQPHGIKIELKPHQLALLHRCRNLESTPLMIKEYGVDMSHEKDVLTTRLGVIGDRVGSGKSYVILALISENINCPDDLANSVVKSFAGNLVSFYLQENKQNICTNLLVIPHNLTSQWCSYISNWGMKHILINKKTMNDILEDNIDITEYPLVIVTSTYYNRMASYCMDNNYKLQRVIFDEVDNLNMPGCKPISAKFVWLVSASYGNILYPRGFTKWDQTLHKYVWCASGITNSGYIKTVLHDLWQCVPKDLTKLLILKNQDAFIDKSNVLPPYQKNIIQCKTPRSIHVLNGIVDRNIIDCLNANDLVGAMAHVNPSNKGTEDNIVDLLIQKYNKMLGNLNLKLQYTRQCAFDTEQERETEITRITTKVQDLESKMKMVADRIKQADMCTICYDDIVTKTITRCCQNSFCFKCINIWLSRNNKCPMCKTTLQMRDMFSVVNESSTVLDDAEMDDGLFNKQNDKYQNISVLLQNRNPNSKFLIFSNYDNSFTSLYPILDQLNLNYMYLKGNGYVIKNIIERYKTGDVDVLLINSRHNGCGLNLENTTDMIMFHKFDTQIEHQVIGRAQRLGRQSPLNVWYFLYENECSSEL